MVTSGQAIEFIFELSSDATGAPVTAPANLELYIVRPGSTVSEKVPSATFENVSSATFKTFVPAEYVVDAGLLVAFVVADGAASNTVGVFQVDQPLALNQDTWIPFVARSIAGAANTSLLPAGVDLSLDLGSPLTRSVPTVEFAQLLGALSSPTPFYMVLVRYSELTGVGSLAYALEGSGLRVYSGVVEVGGINLRSFIVRVEPALSDVTVEFIQANAGVLLTVKTNSVGEVAVSLPDGTYVVRISKSNKIFSQNNTEIVVTEAAGYFVVSSVNTEPAGVPVGFTKITFRLLQPNGEPLAGKKLLFLPTMALTGAGEGVVKQAMPVVTDSDGRGEINLIPGLNVTVNVEGTRLYESFTVPNVATADLFVDNLISFSDKGFEVYVADFEYGIRRTLNP